METSSTRHDPFFNELLNQPVERWADPPIVLGSGALEYQKGPDLFVKVAVEVCKRHPTVEFWWVGDGGADDKWCDDIKEGGLGSRVVFLAFVPSPWAIMRRAAAFFMSSREESLSEATLAAVKIDGELLEVYSVGRKTLSEVVGSRRASFLLVDGPSGGGPRRHAALRLLLPYLREGTRLYLDDALRDWELAVVRRWLYEGYVVPERTYLFDKALFVGRVRRDTASEVGAQREF